MTDTPQISDAEWLVMNELWGKSPQTAQDVAAALQARTQWNLNTVKTLINRLVVKEAVSFTKQGREHHYQPRVSQDQCARAESRSFLDRVFGGACKPMLASFLQHEQLSGEDIQELKRLLDAKAKDLEAGRG